MPLGSFSGFQPYKTANFKGAFPKTEVLGKPQIIVDFTVPLTFILKKL
jgi:hypothetical protein